MKSPFLDLLRSIDAGITIYEPARRTAQALTEFQDMAARLLEMEQVGLISQVHTEVQQIAGAEYYNLVMVTRGLTTEGRRMLAATSEQTS